MKFHVNRLLGHEISRLVISENKVKIFLECCLLQILLGTLRVHRGSLSFENCLPEKLLM